MAHGDQNLTPPCLLPERFFAAGEEPAGVRVSPYHKAGAIKQILNALQPDEIEKIRVSPFGKLIEIAEKPSFSGRFGRFIISRQLKVVRKHEAWFLFVGKPIRFSIREFALVTGLNCSKLPKRSKKKAPENFITKKPYWIELFGSLKDIPVSTVVRMLEKNTVVDPEIRLKYAYLSLLAAVLLPTTHTPRISQEYAEKIKNLDEFFACPWGRVSFDMLMSSIKERKEVSLLQNTIALKGFVLSLQLVMIECVPALTEVVQDGSSSGEDDTSESEKSALKSISPGHARDIDSAGKSIMLDDNGEMNVDPDFQYSDDEDDVRVANMVNLIDQQFPFVSGYFVGGSTKEEVSRMRTETKAELVNRKAGKTKPSTSTPVHEGVDVDLLACIVREKMQEDLQLLHGIIAGIQESVTGLTNTVLTNFSGLFEIVEDSVAKISALSGDIQNLSSLIPEGPMERSNNRPNVADASTQTIPDTSTIISEAIVFANQSTEHTADGETIGVDGVSGSGVHNSNSIPPEEQPDVAFTVQTETTEEMNLDPGLVFPNPTFSLGLTQEAAAERAKKATESALPEPETGDEEPLEPTIEECGNGCRKSKRQRVPTKSLMGEYQCDKAFLNRARQALADAIYKGGDIDYAAKFASLLDKMKTNFSIPTERGDIASKDLYELVQRSSQIPNKVMDVLMMHTSNLFKVGSTQTENPGCLFLDTQFVSQFMKLYTNFAKVTKKETFTFSANVVQFLHIPPSQAEAGRFYFPFYLDKKYWVGICVDCSSWSITVLDCNNGLRTDYMMNKEVRPIALMFPYLLKQAGRVVGARECKPMAIERPQSIPQQNSILSSSVSTVLFIQAHAVGGVDACKCITTDVLDSQVERIVVSLYEASVGLLEMSSKQ